MSRFIVTAEGWKWMQENIEDALAPLLALGVEDGDFEQDGFTQAELAEGAAGRLRGAPSFRVRWARCVMRGYIRRVQRGD